MTTSDILTQANRIILQMLHVGLRLLHHPPAFHPFILSDVLRKHLPPPFLQHVGKRKRGHDGERLFHQEVDLCFCKDKQTQKTVKDEGGQGQLL